MFSLEKMATLKSYQTNTKKHQEPPIDTFTKQYLEGKLICHEMNQLFLPK